MLKKILTVSAVVVFSLAFTIKANAYSYWTSSSKIGASHFSYKEPGDSDSGMQYSLIQRFNYHNNLWLAVFRYSAGYTIGTYKGFASNGTSASSLNSPVHYKNWSVLGGFGIDYRLFAGRMQNQLYVSLSEENMTWMTGRASGGYDETYNTKYAGLNYKNIYAITSNFSTVIGLKYRYGIGGYISIPNYPLYMNQPSESIGLNLSGESGYGALVGVRYRINNNISLTADVVYNKLSFKQSNTATFETSAGNYTLQEPSSNTTIEGLEIGFHYDF
jgi:hypothetical protein